MEQPPQKPSPESVPEIINGREIVLRTPQERASHIESMKSLVMETGFSLVPAGMEREQLQEWYAASQKAVDADPADRRLALGFILARAQIYYELEDKQSYIDEMELALEAVSKLGDPSLEAKVAKIAE